MLRLHILNPAAALEEKSTQLAGTELETFAVPSSYNITKRHVVDFMANGKCECQDCPGYTSLSLGSLRFTTRYLDDAP